MSQAVIDVLDKHITDLRNMPVSTFLKGQATTTIAATLLCARSILQDQENRIAALERERGQP